MRVGSRVGIGAPAVASPPPRLLLWVAGFLVRFVLDHRILGIRFATQLLDCIEPVIKHALHLADVGNTMGQEET